MFDKLGARLFGKKASVEPQRKPNPIEQYLQSGRIPWSKGYNEYKWKFITESLSDSELLNKIAVERKFPDGFGIGLDDRAPEYPWIFANLIKSKGRILDAGSTFNFSEIVSNPILSDKELTILTFHPEPTNFNSKRVSYVYSDLRDIPHKSEYFDQVICQSTIEHIDKDNSIYGYDIAKVQEEKKSFEYLKAVKELVRVLKPGGQLLITFPYGKFEDHGFFQQFDSDMLGLLQDQLRLSGRSITEFLLYSTEGWQFAKQVDCEKVESYNPHTGRGKGTDGAAHCRCICCISFTKGA